MHFIGIEFANFSATTRAIFHITCFNKMLNCWILN